MKNIIFISLLGILFTSCDSNYAEVMLTKTGEHKVIKLSNITPNSDTVVVETVYRDAFKRSSCRIFGSYVGVLPNDTLFKLGGFDVSKKYAKAIIK